MHDLFVKIQHPDHCLYQFLPLERSTTNLLTESGHNVELYEYNYKFFRQSYVVNCSRFVVFFFYYAMLLFVMSLQIALIVHAYTFDMCNNKVYLLTYLITLPSTS